MYKIALVLSLCALWGCTSTKTIDKTPDAAASGEAREVGDVADAGADAGASYHLLYHEDEAGALRTTLLGPTGEVVGGRAGLLIAAPDGALRVVEIKGAALPACAGCKQDPECPSSIGAQVMTLESAPLDGGAATTFRPEQAPKESIDKTSYKSELRVRGVHDGRIFVRFGEVEYMCGSAGEHVESHELVVTAAGAAVQALSLSPAQREEAAKARRSALMEQVKARYSEASEEHVTLSLDATWPDWRGDSPVWRERYTGVCSDGCAAMVDEPESLDVELVAQEPPAPLTFVPAVSARWQAVTGGRGLGWAAVSAAAIKPALEGFK